MSLFKWSKGDKENRLPPNPVDDPQFADDGATEEAEQPESLPSPQPPQLKLPPSPPMPELTSGQYASSEQHLWDELRRIDQLVRAQTLRWRLTIGAAKPERRWGMVQVTDAEINAYLRSQFTPPDTLSQELEPALAAYRRQSAQVAETIEARRAETPPEVQLRLDVLRILFGLSEFERDIILVCLLPELDARYRRLYGYLQDDASRTKPPVELVLEILQGDEPAPEAARAAFDGQSPLLRHHLIVVGEGTGEPLPMRSVRVDDRITSYLLGGDLADARLGQIVGHAGEAVSWDSLYVEFERLSHPQTLGAWWRRQRERGGATIFLHGPYGSARLDTARALCTDAGTRLLVADVTLALRAPHTFELLVDLAYREARLQGAALYWSHCEQLLESEQMAARWDYLVTAAEWFENLTFLAGETAWDPVGRFRARPFLRLDFHAPSYELRRRLWAAYMPHAGEFAAPVPAPDTLADQLANGFQLTGGQIADAVGAARELAVQRDPLQRKLTAGDLFEGCRRQSNRRLMTFARRLEPRTGLTFDDLILPPQHKRQLEELRQRIGQRNRVRGHFENRLTLGNGLIALFTGSSGTGKTMAAGLLAQEQGVDLYKADLSSIVSKYVGDTEKNLNRIFAEAEDANAIIFFDEGEALFGQRGSKTETGQDRWANMEVNFLLQRVEEYTGVVIIASNLRQNIDEAFVRRIHVIVEFPFPEAEGRFRIWSGLFPPDIARPPDEDLRGLAERFRLSGGSLSNVVVDAAFRALAEAGEGQPEIKLRHLVLALAREFQKMGKPITKGEFGEEFYKWIEQYIL